MGKGRKNSKRSSGDEGAAKTTVLDALQPQEALLTVIRLVAAHPELLAEVEAIARSVLGDVSFESIADEVEDAVRQLTLDDMNGRAGKHSWGYVEPTEAAWELLEEAVEPYVEDMKRKFGAGLESEALVLCQGIVLGLYRLRDPAASDFLAWAEDFPGAAAGNAIEELLAVAKEKKKTGGQSRKTRPALANEFATRYVPEWHEMVKRISGKTTP